MFAGMICYDQRGEKVIQTRDNHWRESGFKTHTVWVEDGERIIGIKFRNDTSEENSEYRFDL